MILLYLALAWALLLVLLSTRSGTRTPPAPTGEPSENTLLGTRNKPNHSAGER